MNNILSSFIETEKELVGVERIADYIQNIPREESNYEVENVDRFLFCRSAVGQIDFTCEFFSILTFVFVTMKKLSHVFLLLFRCMFIMYKLSKF